MQGQMIPLREWAKRAYDPPPSDWTLRQWRQRGEILPTPELVGREYYVRADARRLVPRRATVVERLMASA